MLGINKLPSNDTINTGIALVIKLPLSARWCKLQKALLALHRLADRMDQPDPFWRLDLQADQRLEDVSGFSSDARMLKFYSTTADGKTR